MVWAGAEAVEGVVCFVDEDVEISGGVEEYNPALPCSRPWQICWLAKEEMVIRGGFLSQVRVAVARVQALLGYRKSTVKLERLAVYVWGEERVEL